MIGLVDLQEEIIKGPSLSVAPHLCVCVCVCARVCECVPRKGHVQTLREGGHFPVKKRVLIRNQTNWKLLASIPVRKISVVFCYDSLTTQTQLVRGAIRTPNLDLGLVLRGQGPPPFTPPLYSQVFNTGPQSRSSVNSLWDKMNF